MKVGAMKLTRSVIMYSAAGRLLAAVDPLGNRVEVVRDGAGRDAGSIDALGRRLTKEFDDLGNLAALRLPDGSSWEFVHDALSRLTRVADASGATWSLEHDIAEFARLNDLSLVSLLIGILIAFSIFEFMNSLGKPLVSLPNKNIASASYFISV